MHIGSGAAPIAVALRVGMAMLAMAVSGCSAGDDSQQTAAVTNFTPPATRTPTPVAGQAQTTPLTAYVGKYPHDAVDGVDFFDRTEVAGGLLAVVDDARLRSLIRGRSGPQTPIFQRGRRIASWGCEAHNCGDHNWMVAIDPAGGTAQACYHDAGTMQDQSRWYADGAPVLRPGACPSEGGNDA